MNEALQTLEVKVENNGTTPQGKIFAREWNVMVEAVKALDLKEFDEAKLLQFLRDKGFITSEDIPDVDFSNVVTLSGQQIISGAKDFVGGIKVNGMPITYNAVKKAWEFKGDVVVTGAITMFGSLSGFQPSTVTEAVEVDGETIVKTKNSLGQWQLTAIGGGSGTGGGISAAEVNILIENALKPYIKIATADDKYALISTVSGINSRLSAVETFFATEDSDTLINKWSEIVAFLNATEGDTLDNILATKANQSALDAAVASLTTEIGKKWTQNDAKISNWDSAYGWGNHANAGYAAKTYVDAELEKYVKLATAQPIEAQHNFVNGLQIGGLPITKSASANNTIYLDANLVVSGAITMFGSGSTTFPSIWANIPFDLNTMEWTGSVWRVKGGGSGGLDTNAVNVLISDYLTQNSYATISDVSSALVGYATQSWVGDNYLSKSGGTVSGSFRAFEVKRTDEIGSFVSFSNNNGYMGSLGFRNTDTPGFFDSTGSAYFLIHSGNIGNYKAGDADSAGRLTAILYSGDINAKDLYYGTSYVMRLHENVNLPSDMYYGNILYIGGADTGFMLAGAYGSDKLLFRRGINADGPHQTINTNAWKQIAFTDSNVLSPSSGTLSINGIVAANIFKGSFNGQLLPSISALDCNNVGSSHGWVNPASGFTNTPFAGELVSFDAGEGLNALQFLSRHNIAELYVRHRLRINNNWSSWREVAFVDSTVEAANHLAAPHTIWGQSFDGTKDISGLLTDVDGIQGSTTDGGYIGDRNKGLGATDGGSMIYNYSSSPITFHINGSERMRITSGGNVAVGGTTADAKLHIHGTNAVSEVNASGLLIVGESNGTHLAIDENDIQAKSNANTLSTLYLNGWGGNVIINESNAGKVGIGTPNPTVKFHIHYSSGANGMTISRDGDECSIGYVSTANSAFIAGVWGNSFNIWNENYGTIASFNDGGAKINGNLLTTGVVTMFSQLSMKNVIDYDGLSLERLAQIKPARFTWKDSRDTLVHAGGIADEVMRVLPEVVHRTKDDKLTMDYGSAAFYIGTSLIKPVIDHETRIKHLEAEVKALKNENQLLKQRVA